MKDFLKTLLSSLNSLEVKGKDNLDILLGCMFAIEEKIKKIDAESEETEAVNNG